MWYMRTALSVESATTFFTPQSNAASIIFIAPSIFVFTAYMYWKIIILKRLLYIQEMSISSLL